MQLCREFAEDEYDDEEESYNSERDADEGAGGLEEKGMIDEEEEANLVEQMEGA